MKVDKSGVDKKVRVILISAMIVVMAAPIILAFIVNNASALDVTIDRRKDIQMALQDPANSVPGKAALIIYSNTEWSGSIMDSSFGSSTVDGSGDKRVEFQCTIGGIYSLAFQKHNADGYLFANVIQDGKVLDGRTTTAEYGMVTIAGHCD